MLSAAMIIAMVLVAVPHAQADDTMVTDPTTFNNWESESNPVNPSSTGRVWVDKSVSTQVVELPTGSNNSTVKVSPNSGEFLVGLSALSSAVKTSGMVNATKPLDIVLVLDTSGSMNESMNDDSYTPVYTLDQSKTYYIRDGNDYREVEWNIGRRQWGYYSGWFWNRVIPMENETDTGHTQFYSRETRMDALKTAVNGFIDQTAQANQKITDVNKQNRIGIVAFSSEAINKTGGFTSDAKTLKQTVNGLEADGATYADSGFKVAEGMLEKGKRGSSQVSV